MSISCCSKEILFSINISELTVVNDKATKVNDKATKVNNKATKVNLIPIYKNTPYVCIGIEDNNTKGFKYYEKIEEEDRKHIYNVESNQLKYLPLPIGKQFDTLLVERKIYIGDELNRQTFYNENFDEIIYTLEMNNEDTEWRNKIFPINIIYTDIGGVLNERYWLFGNNIHTKYIRFYNHEGLIYIKKNTPLKQSSNAKKSQYSQSPSDDNQFYLKQNDNIIIYDSRIVKQHKTEEQIIEMKSKEKSHITQYGLRKIREKYNNINLDNYNFYTVKFLDNRETYVIIPKNLQSVKIIRDNFGITYTFSEYENRDSDSINLGTDINDKYIYILIQSNNDHGIKADLEQIIKIEREGKSDNYIIEIEKGKGQTLQNIKLSKHELRGQQFKKSETQSSIKYDIIFDKIEDNKFHFKKNKKGGGKINKKCSYKKKKRSTRRSYKKKKRSARRSYGKKKRSTRRSYKRRASRRK